MTKKVYRDPFTGDELSAGEYVSWFIQGIIRRWSFLIVILVVTVICWTTNNEKVLLWWNLSASLLAIMIEAIVGKGMFGQTHRDATVLREVRVILREVQAIADRIEKLEQHEVDELDLIEHKLVVKENTDA